MRVGRCRALAALLAAALLPACMNLAPSYERPPAPVATAWPVRAEGTDVGAPAAADVAWSEFYGDAELRRLIDLALAANRDLRTTALDIEAARVDQYLPLNRVQAQLAETFSLEHSDYATGGPARYVRVKETGGRIGFITPLTHNFCESCNRVRVTCTGTLYMCLGQEDAADLRAPLRQSASDDLLHAAIERAILRVVAARNG